MWFVMKSLALCLGNAYCLARITVRYLEAVVRAACVHSPFIPTLLSPPSPSSTYQLMLMGVLNGLYDSINSVLR